MDTWLVVIRDRRADDKTPQAIFYNDIQIQEKIIIFEI